MVNAAKKFEEVLCWEKLKYGLILWFWPALFVRFSVAKILEALDGKKDASQFFPIGLSCVDDYTPRLVRRSVGIDGCQERHLSLWHPPAVLRAALQAALPLTRTTGLSGEKG